MRLVAFAWAGALVFAIRTLAVAGRSDESIPVTSAAAGPLPRLSIIVPARDEERQIERCIRSLLRQEYDDFEVIAVDDRSADATPQILEDIARNDPRLRVVRGETLPAGWIGKPWALEQGARAATGEWLLFTDADTLHEPQAAASAVTYALAHEARIVSLLPTQLFVTPAERVLLPTILWMIAFAVGSLDAINDPARTDAAIFNGQYLLFERNAYEALGGHAVVRGCIAEDYEFARIVKQDGRFRSRLAGASDLVFTRMYRSAGEIWQGFTKNLYVAAQDNPAQAVAGILLLAALSPIPEIALARALLKRRPKAVLAAAAAIVLAAAAAEYGMRRSRFPRGSGAFFPIGAVGMLAVFLNSALAHRTGGVRWRGRRYGRRTTRGRTQTPGGYGDRDASRSSEHG